MGLCLIRGERGRNEDGTVYVQPGSIYLAIGAKTSSVYVTGKISIWQTLCFSTGEKVPGIHLLRPSSYTQVTLNDCSHQPEEEGSCDPFALHCTQPRESCTFCL